MSISDLSILPQELIYRIIPFTYQTQSKELLYNIRNFHTDLNIIKDGYVFDYDGAIVLYNLLSFCNRDINVSERITVRFEKIMKRHLFFKEKKSEEVCKYICTYGNEGRTIVDIHAFDYIRKYRLILGLLTSDERTRFINRYVLEEEDTYYIL